ncbi:hypothetical protein [Belliella aquatica]|nr:hypothetical protein [Belliella aquatica]MCH7406038.1 hypothetical protein [Belliella aquatica]
MIDSEVLLSTVDSRLSTVDGGELHGMLSMATFVAFGIKVWRLLMAV